MKQLADCTGLEPVNSTVTGWHDNQLHQQSVITNSPLSAPSMSCTGWQTPQWISFELPSGIEPNYLDYKSSASPAMLWKLLVLRTGLEPVSSPVKGECPNQLDERSVSFIKPIFQITYTNIRKVFHISKSNFGGEYWIRTNAPIARWQFSKLLL